MKAILAIDPGASGGYALYSQGPERSSITTGRMYAEPMEMVRQYQEMCGISVFGQVIAQRVCYLEQITGWVAGSKTMQTSSFKMGRNFGHWEMLMASGGIPIVMVPARNWQKYFVGTATRKSTELKGERWKSFLKEKAQEHFPNHKVTLYNADALLILKYAMHREGLLAG